MSGWTGEKLLTRVRKVSVWKKGDQRAPHKPLLILYALGKLLEGQDEIQLKDFYARATPGIRTAAQSISS
jgi:predicted restriction endonuclease